MGKSLVSCFFGDTAYIMLTDQYPNSLSVPFCGRSFPQKPWYSCWFCQSVGTLRAFATAASAAAVTVCLSQPVLYAHLWMDLWRLLAQNFSMCSMPFMVPIQQTLLKHSHLMLATLLWHGCRCRQGRVSASWKSRSQKLKCWDRSEFCFCHSLSCMVMEIAETLSVHGNSAAIGRCPWYCFGVNAKHAGSL